MTVFCKNLSFSHMTENMAVSPVKIDDDIHTAGFHKPDFADRGPRPDNNLILFVFALFRTQAAKQLRDFALADSMKQRRVGKKKSIHENHPSVVATTYALFRL